MELVCTNLNFNYEDHKILNNFSITIPASSHYWVKGKSGSGKSTFLKVLAGEVSLLSGELFWSKYHFSSLTDLEKNIFRKENISFINQDNTLINHWTVLQNLQLFSDDNKLIEHYLNYFELSSRIFLHKIGMLSGGERQRISLITMFLKRPSIILIDEPTSHLDDSVANKFLILLKNELSNSTVVLVSHDNRVEKYFENIIDFERKK